MTPHESYEASDLSSGNTQSERAKEPNRSTDKCCVLLNPPPAAVLYLSAPQEETGTFTDSLSIAVVVVTPSSRLLLHASFFLSQDPMPLTAFGSVGVQQPVIWGVQHFSAAAGERRSGGFQESHITARGDDKASSGFPPRFPFVLICSGLRH